MNTIEQSYEILSPGINQTQFYHTIENAGRTCYKSESSTGFKKRREFVKMLVEKGHESVLEHCSFSVRFIVDRGVSHELVRHRLCAFSQESTRYVNYGKKPMSIIHPSGLSDIQRIRREMHYDDCYRIYMTELEEGIAPQIARGILPTALKTEIVVTANLRQWRHMLKLRTAPAAHPQMREVMVPLLEHLKNELPEVFGDI